MHFFFASFLAVIFNLRQFEFVYLMTNGGPANRTSVLVLYIWKELSIQRLGLGNAAGVIMIVIGAILLIIMRKNIKKRKLTIRMKIDLSTNLYFILNGLSSYHLFFMQYSHFSG